jgi:hypothetical protein
MNDTTENLKPKLQIVIEDIDLAVGYINHAVSKLSAIGFDLQKGSDWLGNYRDSMIKAIADTGGDVAATIEHQFRDYVGKGQVKVNGDVGPQA